jgi:hypothetical protein
VPNNTTTDAIASSNNLSLATAFTGLVVGPGGFPMDVIDYWIVPSATGGNVTLTYTGADFGDMAITIEEFSDVARTISTGSFALSMPSQQFTLNATRFYAVRIEGTAIESTAMYNLTLASGTLPVQLISFKGAYADDYIQLNWATASEINSDFFDIERSIEGKNFVNIGRVQAYGTSNTLKTYQFKDELTKNVLQYYRLKQVDKDGSFQYSRIIAVSREKSTPTKVYPNPATNLVIVEAKNADPIKSMTIYNAIGQIVLTENRISNVLNINTLHKGIYILELTTEAGIIEKLRLIKE